MPRSAARTILQTTVGLAVALPLIVDAAGVPESLPWVAAALAVAGGLARVMAVPAVQRLLPGWLRTDDTGAARDAPEQQSVALELERLRGPWRTVSPG